MRLVQKVGDGHTGQQSHSDSSSGCGRGRRRQRRRGEGYDDGKMVKEDGGASLLPGLEPQMEAVRVCGM